MNTSYFGVGNTWYFAAGNTSYSGAGNTWCLERTWWVENILCLVVALVESTLLAIG